MALDLDRGGGGPGPLRKQRKKGGPQVGRGLPRPGAVARGIAGGGGEKRPDQVFVGRNLPVLAQLPNLPPIWGDTSRDCNARSVSILL